jgi:hypothetical protein
MEIVVSVECLLHGNNQWRNDPFAPFDHPVRQGGTCEVNTKTLFRNTGYAIQWNTVNKFARTYPNQHAR